MNVIRVWKPSRFARRVIAVLAGFVFSCIHDPTNSQITQTSDIPPSRAEAPDNPLPRTQTFDTPPPRVEATDIPPPRAEVPALRFMAIGDMGTGQEGQRVIARAMADRARKDGVDFILTVGDNFYEDGVQSVDDPQWQTKFEWVYADPALADLCFFATLGNHDHRGNVEAQIAYSQAHPDRWRMPGDYYDFTRSIGEAHVHFIALDTTPIAKGAASARRQLDWLDATLEASEADWTLVFGHHAIYSNGPHGDNEPLRRELEPILVKHGVDLYLAGHDHTLEMLKPIDGVHYVVTGAGAGPGSMAYPIQWNEEEAYYAATQGGFTYYRVEPNRITIEFVRPNGETEYAHKLTK